MHTLRGGIIWSFVNDHHNSIIIIIIIYAFATTQTSGHPGNWWGHWEGIMGANIVSPCQRVQEPFSGVSRATSDMWSSKFELTFVIRNIVWLRCCGFSWPIVYLFTWTVGRSSNEVRLRLKCPLKWNLIYYDREIMNFIEWIKSVSMAWPVSTASAQLAGRIRVTSFQWTRFP